MATVFKNVLYSGLGTTPVTVLTTASNAKTTVIGLSLTNMTSGVVLASVLVTDTVALTSAYFIKDVILPPNESLRVVNGGERLVLGASTSITLSSTAASSLDVVMSYVEIV